MSQTTRSFLVPSVIGLLTLVSFIAPVAIASETKPNILVILSDDYGYGSAGCYGANPDLIRTPSIDRMAREGRRFTDANTTSSVCSPTRYALLTGRYCWRTSLTSGVLSTFAPLHIEPERLNMASILKKHGYTTAAVGKWHLGYGIADDSPKWRPDYAAELSPGPLDIGFDYHFSVPSNHGDVTGIFVENRYVYGLRSGKIPAGMKIAGPVPDDDHFKPTYEPQDMENPKSGANILDIDAPRRKNERVMAELTDKATEWLKRQPQNQPFFLYFTPVAVHNPITPDQDLAGKSAAGLYGDWIAELDRSVGRILDTLEQHGVADNTLVIFTSDNGGVTVSDRVDDLHAAAEKAGLAINGSLRGRKHTVWEGGFKVPFIVRWPGHAAAGSSSKEMISLVDLLATTAAIVGEPLPPTNQAAEDSRNILPAILGDPAKPIRDDMIVHSSDGVFAIRKGRWKWIEGVPVDSVKPAVRKSRADEFHPQLYDTQNDPAETSDVAADHADVVNELKDLLVRYRDGGYSRVLPPEGVKVPKVKVVEMPPLTGNLQLSETLAQTPAKPWTIAGGQWQPRDGGLWGIPADADRPAGLRVPLKLTDGTIQYEVSFAGANRTSLRIDCGDREGSFRIEISRTAFGITKNPAQGEGKATTDRLARASMKLDDKTWYPVRIKLHGGSVTAQVNGVTIEATHPVIAETKTAANFLVFGESAGFRNVQVVGAAK